MSADVILNKDRAVLHPHTRYTADSSRMNGQLLETPIDSMSSSSLDSTRSIGQHSRKPNDDVSFRPIECHPFSGQVIFDDIEEDPTVISAYDPHTSVSEKMDTLVVSGEIVYDDIGESVYGMDNGTPVLFDEPLDVGYKLARWSESLTTYKSKSKRHSDEILYQNNSTIHSETKRHSGEVLYDETTSRYHLRSESSNSNQSAMHDDNAEHCYGQAKPHRLRMIYSDIDSPPLSQKLKMQKIENQKSSLADDSRVLSPEPVCESTLCESVKNCSANEFKASSDKNSTSETHWQKIESISAEISRSAEQQLAQITPEKSSPGRTGIIIYDDTMEIYESLDKNNSNHKELFDAIKSPYHSPSSSGSQNNELQSNPPLSPDKTPPTSPDHCDETSCIIGNVPIAVYDQSPRRYGPKPGYPTRNVQDIILQDDSISITDSTSTEEEFNELEYKLYHVHTGSQYVGKRLAQSYTTSFSSPKPLNIIEKMGPTIEIEANSDEAQDPMSSQENLQDAGYLHHEHSERCTISTSNDVEDVIIDPAEAETMEPARNFSLSSEATECDSVEAESEMSLDNESNLHDTVLPGSGMPILEDGLSSGHGSDTEPDSTTAHSKDNPTLLLMKKQILEIEREIACKLQNKVIKDVDYKEMERFLLNADQSGKSLDYRELEKILFGTDRSRNSSESSDRSMDEDMMQEDKERKEMVELAIKDIKQAIRKSKSITLKSPPMEVSSEPPEPVWVLRDSYVSKLQRELRHSKEDLEHHEERKQAEEDTDTDQETDHLLGKHKTDDRSSFYDDKREKRKSRAKEVLIHEPAVLIEGVLFRARYLGSTQLLCEGRPTKASRMMQAQEAVSRIKAPEGESQPSTEVDLFISTEKIMVLNIDLQEIVMDHSLRTISYIADIGDLVVLMARRRIVSSPDNPEPQIKKTPKMLCHVFESEEAQFIAQSIGQAFQVAYMEFLKANGIEDHSFVKEMDYQEVLNSQEILGDELEMFSKKDKQKEVVVPKQKGEILGLVIVESGWGSMLPTVVIANMAHNGAAARCGQLNIGDQIIAINGISLVGLPLSTCQNYIKNTKNQTVVKLTVVRCPPVVEVRIKRPDTKYQLGFSVQNGVICSLLRGGIAERGGVRVGHRIIEINGQSVVAVPHERIVNLLASSIGEIHMKTMPTSMYRLLTGQETPIYI